MHARAYHYPPQTNLNLSTNLFFEQTSLFGHVGSLLVELGQFVRLVLFLKLLPQQKYVSRLLNLNANR